MGIAVTGMKELLRKMEAMGADVQKTERKAVMAGAEVIRDEIEARAPVGATHNLKDNIVISGFAQDSSGAEYVNVGPKGGKGAPFYGFMVEFGTSKMRPQPFVEPALISKRKEAFAAAADVIRTAIAKGEW